MSFFVEVDSPLGNFASTFESEQEANAWIEAQEADASWGKPERWITFDTVDQKNLVVIPGNPDSGHIDSEQREIVLSYKVDEANSTDEETIMIPDVVSSFTYYLYPKEWTVTGPTDISAQVTKQENLARRARQRAFGGECIDMISYMLELKNLTAAEGGSVIATYQPIIANLQLGNLNDAKELAMAVTPDEIITQAEVDALVAKIDSFIA